MEQLSRKAIFARAAEKLRADFEELRNIPHPGLKGSEGEGILRDFLNKHLPKRFGAGNGFGVKSRIVNRKWSPGIDIFWNDLCLLTGKTWGQTFLKKPRTLSLRGQAETKRKGETVASSMKKSHPANTVPENETNKKKTPSIPAGQ